MMGKADHFIRFPQKANKTHEHMSIYKNQKEYRHESTRAATAIQS